MKIFMFDGRLGKDAEVKTTKNGKQYIAFTVANNVFTNGTKKTEWFDVYSYSTYLCGEGQKRLTKGTYVIVTGFLRSDVNVNNGKVYLNQRVDADNVYIPTVGEKAGSEEEAVSTYTGGTPSIVSENTTPKQAEPAPVAVAAPASPNVNMAAFNDTNEDDLPF